MAQVVPESMEHTPDRADRIVPATGGLCMDRNSQPVAMKHYLQVTNAHFEKAVSPLHNPVQKSAA